MDQALEGVSRGPATQKQGNSINYNQMYVRPASEPALHRYKYHVLPIGQSEPDHSNVSNVNEHCTETPTHRL